MNGLNDVAGHEQPTETTSLLAHREGGSESAQGSPQPPLIEPVVSRIQASGIDSLALADLCPHPFPSPAAEAAFSLIILLQLRHNITYRSFSSLDIWETWSKERQGADALQYLDCQVVSVWSVFLEEDRSVEEIEEALWTPYPYSNSGRLSLRVIDFLSKSDAPHKFLVHRITNLCLLRTWSCGRIIANGQFSFVERLFRKLDAMCTPRVLHAIDLLLLLVYLAILVHFLVLPPSRPADPTVLVSPDSRVTILTFYSCARLLQPGSLSVIPYMLVLLAFLSRLPSVPFPDDFAYGILLFAFSWVIMEFHVPHCPSPLYFLPFENTLPLATLIWHGMSRIFIPVVLFFLPALLLSLFLLSTSLWDMFSGLFFPRVAPAPIETRMAFLSLFAVMFLLMLCSLVMLVLIYPALSSEGTSDPWDRYSKAVGTEARGALARVVVAYSKTHWFPPPFNLIQLAARVTTGFLALIVGTKWEDAIQTTDRVLWRLMVMPLASVVAGFWLWGLKDR